MELQITVQTAAGPLFCMRLAPRIIFHSAPSYAHSQFPAVTLRSHQLFRSFVGNSWCHPSYGRSVCWRHFEGPESFWGLAALVGIDFAMAEMTRFVSSSAASDNVCDQRLNQRSDNMNSSLLPLIFSMYLLYQFFLNGLSNFSDGPFLAESSASDIIAVSGLCGGIYLASAVAAGRLTLITASPQWTPT